jgi:hypothetical protein
MQAETRVFLLMRSSRVMVFLMELPERLPGVRVMRSAPLGYCMAEEVLDDDEDEDEAMLLRGAVGADA